MTVITLTSAITDLAAMHLNAWPITVRGLDMEARLKKAGLS